MLFCFGLNAVRATRKVTKSWLDQTLLRNPPVGQLDFSECPADHGCSDACVPTLLGHQCTCDVGTVLESNGKNCTNGTYPKLLCVKQSLADDVQANTIADNTKQSDLATNQDGVNF